MIALLGSLYLYVVKFHDGEYKDLWVYITALATVFLWIVAGDELGDSNKVSKATFIGKFTEDFFTEKTREILMLIDYKALIFINTHEVSYKTNETEINQKPFPYFLLDKAVVAQLKLGPEEERHITKREQYTAFEIDDCLLGPIESLAGFEKRKLVDIRQVYDDFDHYINLIGDNYAIQSYIEQQHSEEKDGGTIYENFKYLYKKCDSYERHVIQGNEPFFIWKIRWFFCHNL